MKINRIPAEPDYMGMVLVFIGVSGGSSFTPEAEPAPPAPPAPPSAEGPIGNTGPA